MKIALVTMLAENYRAIANITLPVMQEYAERHGYSIHTIILDDGNAYHFKKHEYFRMLFLDGIDAIWYLDIDCLITNLNTKVEDFIDNEHDIFMTEDVHELNGGSLIIKNNECGRWVNGFVLSHKNVFPNEQNVYNHYRIKDPFSRYLKVLRHPSINSYRYDLYQEYPDIRDREQGHHHEGDFVLHVPALGLEHREEVLKNTKIIR